MGFDFRKIFVEYQERPIGLDEKSPRFSWELESDEKDVKQKACRIIVWMQNFAHKDKVVFDTGYLETERSTGITYEGEPLLPCTRYLVCVEVWNQKGESAKENTFFETGFLDSGEKSWDGAEWIGAPRDSICAQNRGVFVIETRFCLLPDTGRAGVVFGAGDYRLQDASKNELGLEGKNYLRFEINAEDLIKGKTWKDREISEIKEPTLDIYRVGYAKEDKEDVPFISVPLRGIDDTKAVPLLTMENCLEFHTLRVEVDGNNSFTWFDEVLVDAIKKEEIQGTVIVGRTLNPRGHNDVLTYPHLNQIGFFAGSGEGVLFQNLTVKNLRTPSRVFIDEKPQGNLYGEKTLFSDLEVRNGCFLLQDCQITKDPSQGGLPMFRSVVSVEANRELLSARLYLTARGIYHCMVNGNEITDQMLPPGLTQYDHRMNYQTYDITEYLQQGANGIGITLASGWWCDAQTFVVKNYNYFGDKEAFLAKLVLVYQDGGRKTIVSDTEHWKYYGEGPYRYAGFFAGEVFDARRESIYRKYSLSDFDDSEWEKPVVCDLEEIEAYSSMPVGFGRCWPKVHETAPILVGEYDAPVKIVAERCAKEWKKLTDKIYIYDLQQEMAGVPRITFHEKKGTKIIIRYAEVLYPDLEEYRGKAGTMMLENYRDAGSTDIYICNGNPEGETYQPRFTFHGYRYIEISNVEKPPKLSEVVSLQYSSVPEFVGTFACSEPLLNRFVENVYWSQKSNFINIPTDCPQRNERMGWAGDTHVFCHTALQNADLKLFYERNLQAMSDLQTKEGQYPEIAPIGGGFGGITYECATIFIAWELYQQYGDLRTLQRFYPGMKRYMDYMKDKGLPGEGNPLEIGPLGDWLAPEETDLQLLWNAFYYQEAKLMEKISGCLKQNKEQKAYGELAKKIRDVWNEKFVDPITRKTRNWDGTICDTQTSYVLGLAYEVMEDRKAAGEHLRRKVRDSNYKVQTGFFGTGLINQVLCECGYKEEATKLMLQTECPSWLYPVTQGATTIWERWDSYTEKEGFGGKNAMNSFNHYSLGSVLGWIYNWILGIKREDKNPGYQHFTLEPDFSILREAKGSVYSPYGKIFSGWKYLENKIMYQCKIPVNSTATVVLPEIGTMELGSGTYEFCWKTTKNYQNKP